MNKWTTLVCFPFFHFAVNFFILKFQINYSLPMQRHNLPVEKQRMFKIIYSINLATHFSNFQTLII